MKLDSANLCIPLWGRPPKERQQLDEDGFVPPHKQPGDAGPSLAARSPRRASPVRGVRDRLERRYLGEGSPSLSVPWGKLHPGCAAVTGLLGLPYHTRVLSRPELVLAGGSCGSRRSSS
jgi:hypothetical protein